MITNLSCEDGKNHEAGEGCHCGAVRQRRGGSGSARVACTVGGGVMQLRDNIISPAISGVILNP